MLRHNLAFKVTLLIVSILIAGFGTLLVLNIRQETQALVVKNQETARLLASSVMETIEIGMLRVRPDIVRRLSDEAKGHSGRLPRSARPAASARDGA